MTEIEYQEFVRCVLTMLWAIIPCFVNSKQRINQKMHIATE